MDGVRVDTWVETGTEISPYYDSMLAKLMVYAPTRWVPEGRASMRPRDTCVCGGADELRRLEPCGAGKSVSSRAPRNRRSLHS